MAIAEVCLEMGWTYQEYREQPQWLLTILESRSVAFNKVQKWNALKQKQ